MNDVKSAILLLKAGRAVWVVVISLILIITLVYGVILNMFDSQPIAILLCAMLFGVLVFLAMFDVKEASDSVLKKRSDDEYRRTRGLRRLSGGK